VENVALEEAQQAVRVAQNGKLPDIELSLSASYLGNGCLMDREFTNGQNIKMPHFGNNLAIKATQLIYGGGVVNTGIAMAKLKEEMASVNMEATRSRVRFMLTGFYLDLYKLQNVLKVYDRNIELAKVVIADTKARNEAGVVLQNDITRYELQLQSLNLGLTQSRNAKLIANNRLCTLLKLPIGSSIQVDKTIIEELPLSQSIEYWQNTATDSSLTLKKADFQLQQTEHSRKIARSERIPKIALYASNHLDGPITIDIDMKNNNINVWTVGVGLKYNLASLYKTNRNLKRADIARLQAAESLILIKENLETEVYSAYTLFVEMFSILETHKKSLELATLNYDVINRRYLNDLAIITDMLDATNSKLEAELNMANAKINLLLRYYNLKRVTGIL
jgi:outer membrane protein TolC